MDIYQFAQVVKASGFHDHIKYINLLTNKNYKVNEFCKNLGIDRNNEMIELRYGNMKSDLFLSIDSIDSIFKSKQIDKYENISNFIIVKYFSSYFKYLIKFYMLHGNIKVSIFYEFATIRHIAKIAHFNINVKNKLLNTDIENATDIHKVMDKINEIDNGVIKIITDFRKKLHLGFDFDGVTDIICNNHRGVYINFSHKKSTIKNFKLSICINDKNIKINKIQFIISIMKLEYYRYNNNNYMKFIKNLDNSEYFLPKILRPVKMMKKTKSNKYVDITSDNFDKENIYILCDYGRNKAYNKDGFILDVNNKLISFVIKLSYLNKINYEVIETIDFVKLKCSEEFCNKIIAKFWRKLS